MIISVLVNGVSRIIVRLSAGCAHKKLIPLHCEEGVLVKLTIAELHPSTDSILTVQAVYHSISALHELLILLSLASALCTLVAKKTNNIVVFSNKRFDKARYLNVLI
jgi:hypothetical protein